MENKKIAVLSDIHGNIAALEAVADDLKKKNIDQVINLGDHISGPLWPKETAEFLMKRDWIHISGNHDRNLINQSPEEMGPSDQFASRFLTEEINTWLTSLKPKFIQDGLYAFHGTPANDNVYLLEQVWNGRARLSTESEIEEKLGEVDGEIILCGHTHIPRFVTFKESVIINPGSVGLQAYDDTEPDYHVMETGTNQACYAVLDPGKNNSVELVFVDYDFQTAVVRALKNNRPDWASGLRSGYLSK